ncbi:MAG: ABC transporter permease [Spirochaetota bacterium]
MNQAAPSRALRHTNRFATMFAAFGAVFKKNALEYVRYPMNLFFGLVMPVIFFLPQYFLIISFAPEGVSAGLAAWVGTQDFFAYLPIGMMVAYVIMTIFWNLGFAIKRLMDIGMLETVWSCPVPRLTYIIGESLFSMARLVVELGLVIVIYRYLYGLVVPVSILGSLWYFVPFVALMYGFGIGFAALVLLVKDANTLVDTSSFLVQGLTGTQNPPQVFPRVLLTVALAIPITHFIDILRVETLGIEPLVEPAIEIAFFIGSAIVFPVIGVLVFNRVERRSRRLGNLHVH